MKSWKVDFQKTTVVKHKSKNNVKDVAEKQNSTCVGVVLLKNGGTLEKLSRTYIYFSVWIIMVALGLISLASKVFFVPQAHSVSQEQHDVQWVQSDFQELAVEEENLDHLSMEVDVVEVDHPDQSFEIVRPPNIASEEVIEVKKESIQIESKPDPKEVESRMPRKSNSQRYSQAKRKFLHGDISGAKEMLEKATLSFDEKKLLSEIHVLECRNLAFDKEYSKALIECEKAQKLTKHERAVKFLFEMDSQAKNLYFEGYALEKVNPEQAMEKYKEAMASSPSFSSWKKKSLDRMRKIQI